MWFRIAKFLVLAWLVELIFGLALEIWTGALHDARAIGELTHSARVLANATPFLFPLGLGLSLVGTFWLFLRRVHDGPVVQVVFLSTLLATLPDLVYGAATGDLSADWAAALPFAVRCALGGAALARLTRGKGRSSLLAWFDRSHRSRDYARE